MSARFNEVAALLRQFAEVRDWQKFHSPKNLACALTVEASELLEIFQWMSEEQSRVLPIEKRLAAESEMADVLSYLMHLAHQLGIDLLDATAKKIAMNEVRYPIEKAKGRSDKYDEL